MEWENNDNDTYQLDDVIRSGVCGGSLTDDSDSVLPNPELIKRSLQRTTLPLPTGVNDIGWKAPDESGLRHSAPIFETKIQDNGLRKTVVNATQSHFREWQEDNGTAAAIGTTKLEQVVDGETMAVHVSKRRTLEDVNIHPTETLPPVSSEPVCREGPAQQESMVSLPSEANGTEINSNPTNATSERISLKDPVGTASCVQMATKSNGLLKMGCGRPPATTRGAAAGEESEPKVENVPHRPVSSRIGPSPYPTRKVVGSTGVRKGHRNK